MIFGMILASVWHISWNSHKIYVYAWTHFDTSRRKSLSSVCLARPLQTCEQNMNRKLSDGNHHMSVSKWTCLSSRKWLSMWILCLTDYADHKPSICFFFVKSWQSYRIDSENMVHKSYGVLLQCFSVSVTVLLCNLSSMRVKTRTRELAFLNELFLKK